MKGIHAAKKEAMNAMKPEEKKKMREDADKARKMMRRGEKPPLI
jgi:hypothetical protein